MSKGGHIHLKQTGLTWAGECDVFCAKGDPSSVIPTLLKVYMQIKTNWRAGRAKETGVYVLSSVPDAELQEFRDILSPDTKYYYTVSLKNFYSDRGTKPRTFKWSVEVYEATEKFCDAHIVRWQRRHDSVNENDRGLSTVNLKDFRSCLNRDCFVDVGMAEFKIVKGKVRMEVTEELADLLHEYANEDYRDDI